MRRKLSAALTFIALAFSLAVTVPRAQDSQQSGQKIVDDFINSRGASYDRPPSRTKTKPKRIPPAPGAPRPGNPPKQEGKPEAAARIEGAKPISPAPTNQEAKGGDGGGATPDIQPAAARPIALGYTLVMEDANGRPAVVGEARGFKFGDRIRLLLETNTNGYLYIFQTQDGLHPQMLYPLVELNDGRNVIGAHTTEHVPVKDWYEFDRPAGTVRVYVILSRKPLEGVPTGDDLIGYCGGREECYWEPKPSEWERIKAAISTDAVEERNSQLAGAQIFLPGEMLTRGLRLSKESPAPAVVRVNSSPAADVLMTVVTLVCK